MWWGLCGGRREGQERKMREKGKKNQINFKMTFYP